MNIEIGTSGSESTFTNAIVATSRQKVANVFTLLDGTKKIQEAPSVKRLFDVVLVRPTAGEIIDIETEYDKNITLNFIHKSITYTVRFIGYLDKSTGEYGITFSLQEV